MALARARGRGGPDDGSAAATRPVTVGMTVPAGSIDPLTVADTGGVCLLSQTGEYLALSDPDLHLQPVARDQLAAKS